MHFHRDMLATCDSYAKHVLRAAARRPLHRLAAARLHLRARRARAVPAPHRRGHDPAREGAARRCCCRRSRSTAPPSASPRRPPTARCWRKLAEHDISSLRKCVSAGETLPKATFDAWQKATGIKILDGIGATEMLHIFIGSPEREVRAGATGKAGAGLRGAGDRRRRPRRAARHGRPPRGARADRLPLSRRRAPDEIRAGRLERHRRHLRDGCRRLLLVPGALRRHDHLGRLQHRRAGGGSRAAAASGGRRMRRGRRARRGARADRQGLCGAARGPHRRRRDDAQRCRTT